MTMHVYASDTGEILTDIVPLVAFSRFAFRVNINGSKYI